MALSCVTLMTYSCLAKQLIHWLSSRARMTWVNRLMGSAFIGLGLSVLRLRQSV